MTNQTKFLKSLGGSPAGASITRLCTLTLAAILAIGGAIVGLAQDQPAKAGAYPHHHVHPECEIDRLRAADGHQPRRFPVGKFKQRIAARDVKQRLRRAVIGIVEVKRQ